MSPASPATTSAGPLWGDRLESVLRTAAATLVDKSIPLAKRVHDVRRAAKEGRALLKLAPSSVRPAAKEARQALREVRKELGPARDARVALGLMQDHADGEGQQRPEFAAMMTILTQRCASAESALKPAILRASAKRLTGIAESIKHIARETPADEIVDRAVRLYRDARRLVPAEGHEPEERALHALRSAVVDHHYQAALMAAIEGRRLAKRAQALQKLRGDLGDYLDALRIQSLLAEHPDLSDHALSVRMRKAQAKRLAKALAAARKLFSLRPKEFRASLEAAAKS